MFKSLDEFLKQASEAPETSEASESTEPVEANASEDGAQDIDWSIAVEQAVNAVWDNESNAEGVVEELDESEDGVDNSADLGDQGELRLGESEEPEEIEDFDEDDESEGEEADSTGAGTADSDVDDTEGLWDLLLNSFGESDTNRESSTESEQESSSSSEDKSELERLKQTVEMLVAWQSAVQEYLQTSIEAENIRTVAQQLASLGVILPDEQIQEIARTSQQLGIPPSVLLKAKAYDYTMQAMRQQGQIPYPFMVNESSVSSAPFAQSASRLIPNARPFRPEVSRTQRTGFTSLEEFLRQMGISE
jgi:hypothetical protein